MMHKKIFTMDGISQAYIGYTDGSRWNGWATPYFTKDEALRLMSDYNKNTESPMFYNKQYDTFYHFGTDCYGGEMWRGLDYNTEDGKQHLYNIGAYCWIWDDVTPRRMRDIAHQTEEFIYYHDKTECQRVELVHYIIQQFTNLDTLCKAIQIIKAEDLTSDERFEKLSEILRGNHKNDII
jgi:hypothetical protein